MESWAKFAQFKEWTLLKDPKELFYFTASV